MVLHCTNFCREITAASLSKWCGSIQPNIDVPPIGHKTIRFLISTLPIFQGVKSDSYFFGLGRWTRGNTECCLLAVKGKPKRVSNKVSQLIIEPIREHSRKPDSTREKIVELIGEKQRIELFARQYAEGWDCWGNEV